MQRGMWDLDGGNGLTFACIVRGIQWNTLVAVCARMRASIDATRFYQVSG